MAHPSTPDHEVCPCGSLLSYTQCCGIYHRQLAYPPTPELLMRSRYTAFSLKLDSYLINTWHHTTRPKDPLDLDLDPNHWVSLEIIHAHQHQHQQPSEYGSVEFKAYSIRGGHLSCLHERSRFIFEGEQWSYLDGICEVSERKLSRNELCPCGSGRKVKRCCTSQNR